MMSYRSKWVDALANDRKDYVEILRRGRFVLWDDNRMPEGSVEDGLRYALDIMYADPAEHLAQAFLIQSQEVARRVIAEDKLRSSTCARFFPHNRARFLRASTYVEAILSSVLNSEALEQATTDEVEWCRDMRGSDWDEVAQAYMLAGARRTLVAGDAERALLILNDDRGFKRHKEQCRELKGVAERAGESDGPITDARVHVGYDAFFDRMRDPSLKPTVYCEREILRFELGVIREKYFVSADRSIDWGRAIDAISA